MVDNFKLIEPLLDFPKGDSFYFIQVLQRKKDHPGVMLGGSNNNSRLIRAYYVRSIERYHQYKEEMIKLCEVYNARASINLNPRSLEKTAFRVLEKIAAQMANRDFGGIASAYNTVCGEYQAEMDKRWIIDIDDPDMHVACKVADYIESIHEQDRAKSPKIIPRRVLAILPSKSGWHIITHKFNEEIFKNSHHKHHEIHRNNPTNLYIL